VDQVGVDFYRDYFRGERKQGFGEGAFARADFDDQWNTIVWDNSVAGGGRDAVQNRFSR